MKRPLENFVLDAVYRLSGMFADPKISRTEEQPESDVKLRLSLLKKNREKVVEDI